ncbi:VOC family protein [Nocardia sp. alder85J]|uniref:VOC family protein n=1 Tax=Nocardia sp. alder85J TaxID=2862949 RepID=UPI001CD5BDB2|nr:VOC family protein [Nocardia sp. alder85J]MCX4097122.1 VOC family protein [Nocardia sp. alder85J]
MSPLFRQLHHVCVVVPDLDAAVGYYQRLGIGPWYDYPKGDPYVVYEVADPVASAALRYKCADLDNVQLQLCEPPLRDCPQRRFLDEFGPGVYHLGFETPDLADAEDRAAVLGLGTIGRGHRADGSGFCYFDTRAEAAVVLEVRRTAGGAASH